MGLWATMLHRLIVNWTTFCVEPLQRSFQKNEKCECNQALSMAYILVTDSIFSSLVQTELLQKARATIGHGSVQEQPTATNDEAGKMDGCDEESTLEMLTRSNTYRCVSKERTVEHNPPETKDFFHK